jgi:hypothetical protein
MARPIVPGTLPLLGETGEGPFADAEDLLSLR